MKNSLQYYLLKLSRSGVGLEFCSVTCRYGEFTMYCIIGPEENLVQVTFAPKKHDRVLKQLVSLNSNVRISKLLQKEFYLNKKFMDYFVGNRTSFSFPADSLLITAGTEFQKRVWRHIGAIPFGSCMTYQRLAALAGSPKAARAAGTACGANPLSVIIPCHRVVSVNGLGGFAGGVSIKKALLALEQAGSNTENNCRQRK